MQVDLTVKESNGLRFYCFGVGAGDRFSLEVPEGSYFENGLLHVSGHEAGYNAVEVAFIFSESLVHVGPRLAVL